MTDYSINRKLLSPGFHQMRQLQGRIIQKMKPFRDDYIWGYPLIGGAIGVYTEMVTSREWTLTGRPRLVGAAYEFLNNSKSIMPDGLEDYGIDQLIQRRVIDSLIIGRRMLLHRSPGDLSVPIEYVDPTMAAWSEVDKAWVYEDPTTGLEAEFTQQQIHHRDAKAIGGSGQWMPPIYPVLRTAEQAYILRELDISKTDGTQIRDIFITSSSQLVNNLEKGLKSLSERYMGEKTDSNFGVVGVDMNGMDHQIDASKLIHRIGISEIPEGFDRTQFMWNYANEIANNLGLVLRTFWNVDVGTNRALEEINEQRQVRKGPSKYIAEEQRIIDSIIKKAGNVHFAFHEEMDLATRKTDAEVMKLMTDALVVLTDEDVLNSELSLVMFGYFQRMGLLPADVDFKEVMKGEKTENAILDNTSERTPYIENAFSVPDYDEVVINSSGEVIDRRRKVFGIYEEIEKQLSQDAESATIEGDDIFEQVYSKLFDKLLLTFNVSSLSEISAEYDKDGPTRTLISKMKKLINDNEFGETSPESKDLF